MNRTYSKDFLVKYLSCGAFPYFNERLAKKLVDFCGGKVFDVMSDKDSFFKALSSINERQFELGPFYANYDAESEVYFRYFMKGVYDVRMKGDASLSPSELDEKISERMSKMVYLAKRVPSFDNVMELGKDPFALVSVSPDYSVRRGTFLHSCVSHMNESMKAEFENDEKYGYLYKAMYLMINDSSMKAGLFYHLRQCYSNGDICCLSAKLCETAAKMCGTKPDHVMKTLDKCIESGILKSRTLETGESYIYLPEMYALENDCAKRLYNFAGREPEIDMQSAVYFQNKYDVGKPSRVGVLLNDRQKKAVYRSLKFGCSVLTGGPGTGKTATINALVNSLEATGQTVALAAPTGKAAKRMSDSVFDRQGEHHSAYTIHRLLGSTYTEDGEFKYEVDEDNPLDQYDVVIIDETSMIDLETFDALLKGISPDSKVVFVGDMDQLPSIGAGSVMHDLLKTQIPYLAKTKLIETYRQSEGSDIIPVAQAVISGKHLSADEFSGKDFAISDPCRRDSSKKTRLSKDDYENAVLNDVLSAVTQGIPQNLGIPASDVQVLSPVKDGSLGTKNLNRILQAKLNPPSQRKPEYHYKTGSKDKEEVIIFRKGDKIMQMRNDYGMPYSVCDKNNTLVDEGYGILNGDTGIIEDVTEDYIAIRFDDGGSTVRKVNYPVKSLSNLSHAFAMTVHKSQGSEYPAVVMALPSCESDNLNKLSGVLNRNLLYTGMTRAKKGLFVVGDTDTLNYAIDNVKDTTRQSCLAKTLEALEKYGDRAVSDKSVVYPPLSKSLISKTKQTGDISKTRGEQASKIVYIEPQKSSEEVVSK